MKPKPCVLLELKMGPAKPNEENVECRTSLAQVIETLTDSLMGVLEELKKLVPAPLADLSDHIRLLPARYGVSEGGAGLSGWEGEA
jgi:hypothetical protein